MLTNKRTEMTADCVYWIERGQHTEERDTEQTHCTIVLADGKRLLYSGEGAIPEVGDIVEACNSLGRSLVLGYFTEHGYFGVLVKPLAPPARWLKQQQEHSREHAGSPDPIGCGNAGFFGSEFELVTPHSRPMWPNGPTQEQVVALALFALANGRLWKQKLNTIWCNGRYGSANLGGADSALLQQVRNSFGPGWLQRLSLKDAL